MTRLLKPDEASALNRLLTARDVAEMLGMSVRWVLAHASQDRRPHITCVRLGTRVRFRPDDVQKFIEQQLKEAA